MNFRRFAPLVLLVALSACTTLPMGAPAAVQGDWRELGVSTSGNIVHAIDTRSVARQGDSVTFRERVSIRRVAAEQYTQTPPYQTAVNEWQMNCRQKTYRLRAVQLFDAAGNVLANHRYAAGRTQAVRAGSASERQFEFVCSR